MRHFIFLRFYLFIFREGKGGRNRGEQGEENINVWLCLLHPAAGDLAHNPGMCPDWELNQWPFGLQASTPSTEQHQSGPYSYIL